MNDTRIENLVEKGFEKQNANSIELAEKDGHC